MVREGWLKNGPGSGKGRGREPFVPVSWDKALDLVAGEIARVRREHGPQSIMGGSQGWSSAGIFHEARVQLHRFLAAGGGFVDSAMNYSFGCALAFLPHVLGSPQSVTGPLTSWSSIARHGKLLVLFGGANPKNTQVSKGGCASHSTAPSIAELARAGVEVINISPIRDDGPEAVRPEWIPIRPNTDTAMLLALTHTLVREEPARQGIPGDVLRRLRARHALSDGRDRRPAEGRRLGRGDHRRSGRHHPHAGAAHGRRPAR